MRRLSWFTFLCLTGCSCGAVGPADGGHDAAQGLDAGSDGGPVCTRTADCDDGLYCNGSEMCEPGNPSAFANGCLIGSAPCASDQICQEGSNTCSSSDCPSDPAMRDLDGDGHETMSCAGGDDCDDGDPGRYTSNTEVCDASGHDEDCVDTTLAGESDGDRDGDGFISATCCNGENCGDDCDDGLREVFPGAREICNGYDDDCDDTVDEVGAFCPVGTCVDRRCRAIGWERVYGTTGRESARTVAVDAAGNAYLSLLISEPLDLDEDGTLDPSGAYIVSISPEGRTRWAAATDVLSPVIAIDPSMSADTIVVEGRGDLTWLSIEDGSRVRTVPITVPDGWTRVVIVGAAWSGGSLYVAGTLENGILESAIVLVRLDETGAELDRRTIHVSDEYQSTEALAANDNGVVLLGLSGTEVDLGDGRMTSGRFVARFDPMLHPIWEAHPFPTGPGFDVALSRSGEVAVVGRSTGAYAPFWGGASWSASDDGAAYAIALSADGAYRWHRRHDGPDRDFFVGAEYDERDGVMVSGQFSGQMDVAPRGRLTAVGSCDAFFGILGATDGDHFVLDAQQYSGSGCEQAIGGATDAFGNVVIAGTFTTDITLPSGSVYTSEGETDVFIVRIADIP